MEEAFSREGAGDGTIPGACVLGVAASKRQQEPAEIEAWRSGPPERSQQTLAGAGRSMAQCRGLAARGAACAPSRTP